MKADAKKNKETKSNVPVGQRVQREVIAWFWVALVLLLINGTIGQARVIPSGSMENTLLIGDHLIMSRVGDDAGVPFTNWHVALWRNPKRQQVIIFKPPFAPDTPDYVKRVIGLPGEVIDVREGAVWINGKRLTESYTRGLSERPDPSLLKGNFKGLPFTVPKDCYFVMGDNRDTSLDSRFVGCVPLTDIIATPVMIYMSLDAPQGAWDSGRIRVRLFAYANALLHHRIVRCNRIFR